MQRITVPPSREEYQAFLISRRFYPESVELVMKSWDWCGKWHAKQKRREDGSDYLDHPRASSWILLQEVGVTDPETIALANLHDVGEVRHRTPPTHQQLCNAFGYRIAYKLEALTKAPGQDVADYSRQVFAGGTKAVIAKFGDRLHNLRTLGACDLAKQLRIIEDTWFYYYPGSGSYKRFFDSVSPKDERIINALWKLMTEAIDEVILAQG